MSKLEETDVNYSQCIVKALVLNFHAQLNFMAYTCDTADEADPPPPLKKIIIKG